MFMVLIDLSEGDNVIKQSHQNVEKYYLILKNYFKRLNAESKSFIALHKWTGTFIINEIFFIIVSNVFI